MVMIANLSWVEANLSDSTVARLVTRLTRKNRNIETGGCGCGCGDEVNGLADKAKMGAVVKQA
jgi:hypothetical protein